MNQLIKYLTKEISKSPGWLPLSVIAFWVLKPEFEISKIVIVNEHSDSLIIAIVAFVYLFGEMIDNFVFPRNNDDGWKFLRYMNVFKSMSSIRDDVREKLELHTGIYQLSKNFVSENSKSLGIKYYFAEIINNASKLSRSLIVPCFVIAGKFIIENQLLYCLVLILVGMILFYTYFFLKTKQMYLYYKYFLDMLHNESFEQTVFIDTNAKEVTMYYWNKKLMYTRLN